MNDKIYHIPVLLKHLVGSFSLKKMQLLLMGHWGSPGMPVKFSRTIQIFGTLVLIKTLKRLKYQHIE